MPKYVSVNNLHQSPKVHIIAMTQSFVCRIRHSRSRSAHIRSCRLHVERVARGLVVAPALSTPGRHAARLYVTHYDFVLCQIKFEHVQRPRMEQVSNVTYCLLPTVLAARACAGKVPVTFRQTAVSARKLLCCAYPKTHPRFGRLSCLSVITCCGIGPPCVCGRTVAVYLQNYIRSVWHFLEADVLFGLQALHRFISGAS